MQRIEAARARELFREERHRAERASERVERAQEDLAEALETRRTLEADVARLEDEYRSSRLTRQQLAAKLARAESDLAVVSAEYEDHVRRYTSDVRKLRETRDELRSELTTTRAELYAQQDRATQLEAETARLQAELDESLGSTELARSRVGELEQSLEALRVSLEATPRPAEAAGPATPPAGDAP